MEASDDSDNAREVELTEEQQELAECPSKKKRKKSSTENTTVPEAHQYTVANMPLPQLSSRVLALFEKEEFFLHLKLFVQEVGDHFRNEIKSSERYIYPRYVYLCC